MSIAKPKTKITAGLFVGILAASVQANIAFITPGMLHALGAFAPFVYGTVSSMLGFLTGYFVREDPATALDPSPAPDVPAPANDVNAQWNAFIANAQHATAAPTTLPPLPSPAPDPVIYPATQPAVNPGA